MSSVNSFFKYTTAIVRGVSSSLPAMAQRLSPSSEPVDAFKANQQFEEYVNILRDQCGLNITRLPADDELPDCVFVEDVVVAIGKKALITTPGHISRRKETTVMQDALRDLGLDLTFMEKKDPTALMDGGDILFTGEEIFVGISKRTNEAGYKVLKETFPEFPVTPIPIQGSLHLKSDCSLAGPGKILISANNIELRKNLQEKAQRNYNYIPVQGDGIGANCLYIDSPKLGETIVCPGFDSFPEAKKVYDELSSVHKIWCNHGEFSKVDGALTCCSVLLAI